MRARWTQDATVPLRVTEAAALRGALRQFARALREAGEEAWDARALTIMVPPAVADVARAILGPLDADKPTPPPE